MTISYTKYIIIAIVVLLAIATGCDTIYTVQEGTRGVLLTTGQYSGTQDPGLHFKTPFFQDVDIMEIRNQVLEWDDHIYSSDTQQYEANIRVQYSINEGAVEALYKLEGIHYAARRLQPAAQAIIKEVAGEYSAQETIQNRAAYGAKILLRVQEFATEFSINVTNIAITNIDFTDEFEDAIEKAMTAKATVEEERAKLEQERVIAEKKVVNAQAEADAARAEANGKRDAEIARAEGRAEAERLIKDAEAYGIERVNASLKQAPEYIELQLAIAAQKWDGSVPEFVMGDASFLPFLNLNELMRK